MNNIRARVFWLLDKFKGSPVRKHYDDIKSIMENPQTRQEKINNQLQKLIYEATKNTDFYARYKGCTRLTDFPIIDKNTIKQNNNAFLSKKYNEDELHYMSTSGSTGTPFTVAQNKEKRQRNVADLIYFNEMGKGFLGDKFIYYRVWNDAVKKSKFESIKQNEIMGDITSLNEKNIKYLINQYKKAKPNYLLGYGSAFQVLTEYLLKINYNNTIKLKGIISTADKLEEKTREDLKKIFNCAVTSRYGNQENGVLAHECIGKEEFHLNIASYVIEILKFDNDEPAEEGEEGRIVVTDLYNYAQPFIRYDTGDVGIKTSKSQCNLKTPVLKQLSGRMLDFVYDTKGNLLSSHIISLTMRPFKELSQNQFIQESEKEYTLKVNGGNYKDKEFIDVLKPLLGDDAIIKIEHVDEIPVVASGKRKHTICKLEK